MLMVFNTDVGFPISGLELVYSQHKRHRRVHSIRGGPLTARGKCSTVTSPSTPKENENAVCENGIGWFCGFRPV